MRTTLELDDDLLATARQLSHQQGLTLGQLISELARQSLAARAPLKVRNGALLFRSDDDLLATARQLSHQQGLTLGQLISELARQSLAARAPLKVRNGALLF